MLDLLKLAERPNSIAIIIVLLLFFSLSGSAQRREISGIVTDQQSVPLAGVSVVVKGVSNGTVTDANGHYVLLVNNQPEMIAFSIVGYRAKEVSVGNDSVINVTLESDATGLDEVVVVGYGTQKKIDLTSSVSTIHARSIENRPVNNLADAMQGLSPGLVVTRTSGQPGKENIKIQIRGASSVNGSADPLLIIDGVTTPLSTLQTLNPTDVQSINILKDASATAIYGAQGAGGVILVTTKNGNIGRFKLNYSTLIGLKRPLNSKPERLSLLDEALYSNLAHKNQGSAFEYSDYDLDNIRKGLKNAPNPTSPGHLVYYSQASEKIPLVLRDNNFTQDHYLSISGGTDKFIYLLSTGLHNETGIFKIGPDGLKRYNFRFNSTTNITNHLSVDARLSYNIERVKAPIIPAEGGGGNSIFFQIFRFRQLYPIWNEFGKLNGYGTGDYSYHYLSQGGYDNTDNNYFDGTVNLKYKDLFVKGLQIDAIYGGQYRNTGEKTFYRKVTEYWGNDPIKYLNNPNRYIVGNTLLKNDNYQLLANYDFALNKNNFHILFGYQYELTKVNSLVLTATNLASNDLPAINLGAKNGKDANEEIQEYAYLSTFGRLNYNYNNKYLFQFSIRKDESSRLAPDLRANYFPSFSAGWNINKEEWFNNEFSEISTLKPRFSWGQVGSSIGIGNFDYLNLLTSGNTLILGDPKTQSIYFYQPSIPSPNLTWERLSVINSGIDIGFFDDKLKASFDLYKKTNNNMLAPINVPATIGAGVPLVNLGKLVSRGWDFELSYGNSSKNQLVYFLQFNLSNNNNKLVKYDGRQVILPGFNHVIENYPINSLWGYRTDGYFQSKEEVSEWAFQNELNDAGDVKYLDLNRDNKIDGGKGNIRDHGDLVYYGTVDPHYSFGFTGSISWKNLDFSIFVQGVGKRSFYPAQAGVQPSPAAYIQPLKFMTDYWTPDNPNAAFPRPYIADNFNYLPSDRRILDGKYVRLKNIQAGYTLSPDLVKKMRISSLRVFLSAQDILTFSGLGVYKKMFDPEARDTEATGTAYPYFGITSIGLNVSF